MGIPEERCIRETLETTGISATGVFAGDRDMNR